MKPETREGQGPTNLGAALANVIIVFFDASHSLRSADFVEHVAKQRDGALSDSPIVAKDPLLQCRQQLTCVAGSMCRYKDL